MRIRTVSNGFVVTTEQPIKMDKTMKEFFPLPLPQLMESKEIIFQDLSTMLRFIEEFYHDKGYRGRNKDKDKTVSKEDTPQ
jgi:hypothetical protein